MKIRKIDLFGIGKKGIYILEAEVEFKPKNATCRFVEHRALLSIYFRKDYIYIHFLFKTKRFNF